MNTTIQRVNLLNLSRQTRYVIVQSWYLHTQKYNHCIQLLVYLFTLVRLLNYACKSAEQQSKQKPKRDILGTALSNR